MPFLLYVRPLSVFNLIHRNMRLIVEVFFLKFRFYIYREKIIRLPFCIHESAYLVVLSRVRK